MGSRPRSENRVMVFGLPSASLDQGRPTVIGESTQPVNTAQRVLRIRPMSPIQMIEVNSEVRSICSSMSRNCQTCSWSWAP